VFLHRSIVRDAYGRAVGEMWILATSDFETNTPNRAAGPAAGTI
jgi:hypothetical protein